MHGEIKSGYPAFNNPFLEYMMISKAVEAADDVELCEHSFHLIRILYNQLRKAPPADAAPLQPAIKRPLRPQTDDLSDNESDHARNKVPRTTTASNTTARADPEQISSSNPTFTNAIEPAARRPSSPVTTGRGTRQELQGRREILAQLLTTTTAWQGDHMPRTRIPLVVVPSMNAENHICRDHISAEHMSRTTIPLVVVPSMNGFIVCGDVVICRNDRFTVRSLIYDIAKKDSFAILDSIENEDEMTVTVRSVTLKLGATQATHKHRNPKIVLLRDLPNDADTVTKIFWAYSNVKHIFMNYTPRTDKQVRGTVVRDVCPDTDEFRSALGLSLGQRSRCRVVYAALPNAKQTPHSHWDNIFGKQWDKLSNNTVLYKLVFSTTQSSMYVCIKMTAYITMCSSFANREDYRAHLVSFVPTGRETEIEDDPDTESDEIEDDPEEENH